MRIDLDAVSCYPRILLQTTQICVRYLGDSADKAGLDFLNRRGTRRKS